MCLAELFDALCWAEFVFAGAVFADAVFAEVFLAAAGLVAFTTFVAFAGAAAFNGAAALRGVADFAGAAGCTAGRVGATGFGAAVVIGGGSFFSARMVRSGFTTASPLKRRSTDSTRPAAARHWPMSFNTVKYLL